MFLKRNSSPLFCPVLNVPEATVPHHTWAGQPWVWKAHLWRKQSWLTEEEKKPSMTCCLTGTTRRALTERP